MHRVRPSSRERGVTILLFAIVLPALMGLLGLAIDLGVAYMVRTSAQAAADAAALAGAFTYIDNPNASDTDAKNNAQTVAQQNSILGNAASASNISTFTCNGGAHCVKLTVSTASPTFFARLFNWKSLPINVTATAQASTVGSGVYCLKPVFAPGSTIKNAAPGTFLPDVRPGQGGGTVGNWNSLDLGSVVSPVPFTNGTSVNGQGTPVYDASWQSCAAVDIKCGTQIFTKTGNLGKNNDINFAQFTDTYVALGEYSNGSVTRDTSPSVVSIAVWDDSQGAPNGKKPITIIGFAQVFMNPYPGHQAAETGYLISYTPCGTGGGTPGPSTGPFAAPVQLVN